MVEVMVIMIERGKEKKEEKLESAVVMEIRINWKFKKKKHKGMD